MPAERPVFGRLLFVLVFWSGATGLFAAGCTVEATGVFVTLELGAAVPAKVKVDLSDRSGSTIGSSHTYVADHIPNPTTFGIELADALDGTTVVVNVRL